MLCSPGWCRPYDGLTSYTEVIQDGMLALLRSGTSRSSRPPHSPWAGRRHRPARQPRRLPRPYRPPFPGDQQSSRGRAPARILAMNGMIEADIYGNVNSTHIMGSSIQNGIGGSGDFARNAYISMFLTRRPPGAVTSPASCRWSATSITPSTTSRSWSPSAGWPTCGDCHPAAGPNASSPLRPPGLSGRITGLPRPRHQHHAASTHRIDSTRPFPGTRGTCAMAA